MSLVKIALAGVVIAYMIGLFIDTWPIFLVEFDAPPLPHDFRPR